MELHIRTQSWSSTRFNLLSSGGRGGSSFDTGSVCVHKNQYSLVSLTRVMYMLNYSSLPFFIQWGGTVIGLESPWWNSSHFFTIFCLKARQWLKIMNRCHTLISARLLCIELLYLWQSSNAGESSSFSFLDTESLCILINFFVLWSIYPSSSCIHFKNSLEYLPWYSFMRILPQGFLVLLRYSFLTFSFISVWWCSLLIFLSISSFLFH